MYVYSLIYWVDHAPLMGVQSKVLDVVVVTWFWVLWSLCNDQNFGIMKPKKSDIFITLFLEIFWFVIGGKKMQDEVMCLDLKSWTSL